MRYRWMNKICIFWLASFLSDVPSMLQFTNFLLLLLFWLYYLRCDV